MVFTDAVHLYQELSAESPFLYRRWLANYITVELGEIFTHSGYEPLLAIGFMITPICGLSFSLLMSSDIEASLCHVPLPFCRSLLVRQLWHHLLDIQYLIAGPLSLFQGVYSSRLLRVNFYASDFNILLQSVAQFIISHVIPFAI